MHFPCCNYNQVSKHLDVASPVRLLRFSVSFIYTRLLYMSGLPCIPINPPYLYSLKMMSPLNIFVMNLVHDNDNNEINKNKFRTPKFMWKSKIGKNQRGKISL